MDYEVIWTDEAQITFDNVISYLTEKFCDKEVSHFILHTDRKIKFILSNPKMYRRSAKHKNIHYTNILRKTLLVYRFQPRKKIIELLVFWDGRQNPKRFKY